MNKIAFVNGYVYDGSKDGDFLKAHILVNDERIEKLTTDLKDVTLDYKIIDLENSYIIPGLINLHAHLFGSGKPSKILGGGNLQKKVIDFCSTKVGSKVLMKLVKGHVKQALYSGVTTLRTSGDFYYSDLKIRDLINKNKCDGPRLFVPGPAITVSGGHGDGTFALTGNSKNQLERLVLVNKEKGVDYIKICVTGGVMDAKKRGEPGELKMSLEQTEYVCNKAHELGLKVASHTESNEGIKVALKAKVDTIEHGSFTDKEDIKLYKDNNSAQVFTISPALPLAKFDPSITKLNEMCVYNSEVILQGMIDGAKKCLENNILVGLGTDASCPFVTQYDMWREIYHFSKYVGVSSKFALHTATLVNATILNKDNEIGSIKEGKYADLLVLNNNPFNDLKVLANPNMVVKNGKVYRNKIKKNKYIDKKLDTLL